MKKNNKTNDIFVFNGMDCFDPIPVQDALPQIGLQICIVNGSLSCIKGVITCVICGVWNKKNDGQRRELNARLSCDDKDIVEKFLSQNQQIKNQANQYMIHQTLLNYSKRFINE